MVPKYVIDVAIIWLNDNIYSRNTWFPTTDVQTQNIGKPRYANRRAPTDRSNAGDGIPTLARRQLPIATMLTNADVGPTSQC